MVQYWDADCGFCHYDSGLHVMIRVNTFFSLIAKRSEWKGTMEWSLSRASAGNVRIHTSPLGAGKEAKPPGSRACPGVGIPFIL